MAGLLASEKETHLGVMWDNGLAASMAGWWDYVTDAQKDFLLVGHWAPKVLMTGSTRAQLKWDRLKGLTS